MDNVHGKGGEAESLTEILARYAEETCDAEVEEVDAKSMCFSLCGM